MTVLLNYQSVLTSTTKRLEANPVAMSTSDSSSEQVTTTARMGPPKYQVTIPKQVREVLDIDNTRSILQMTIQVKKVEEEEVE